MSAGDIIHNSDGSTYTQLNPDGSRPSLFTHYNSNGDFLFRGSDSSASASAYANAYDNMESVFSNFFNDYSSAVQADREYEAGLQREAMEFNAEQARLNRDWQDAFYSRSLADNQASARQAMEFSKSERLAAQEFSQAMSDTSYQRAVQDLRNAGVNPILAYMRGGASTPGSTGSNGVTYSGSSSGGASASTSAYSTKASRSQMYSMVSDLVKTIISTSSNEAIVDRQIAGRLVQSIVGLADFF